MRGHKVHALKVKVARSSFPLISSSPQAHFCLTPIHVGDLGNGLLSLLGWWGMERDGDSKMRSSHHIFLGSKRPFGDSIAHCIQYAISDIPQEV